MKIRYTSRALAQLEAVHPYLAERSAAGTASVSASLRTCLIRLTMMPRLGRRTDQSGVLVLIEPDYGYRIFYRIDNHVTILRILHRSGERRTRSPRAARHSPTSAG